MLMNTHTIRVLTHFSAIKDDLTFIGLVHSAQSSAARKMWFLYKEKGEASSVDALGSK